MQLVLDDSPRPPPVKNGGVDELAYGRRKWQGMMMMMQAFTRVVMRRMDG